MSWEKNVRRVEPYVAGEQPKAEGVIKLNTNECPYPPSPEIKKILEKMDCGKLRLYPDMHAKELVNALADYYHVKQQQVFVGVGSDDVLAMAFMTFFYGERPILFPDITYSFYDVWAEVFRIPYRVCALDGDFRIKKEDYLSPNGGIVIPNPNAPTGVLEDTGFFEEIIASNPESVVIVDEAYVDFGGESTIPLIDRYDNLLVVQTFSKSRAMAGARIGFAIGNEKLIRYLKDVKFSFNSYTMNMPAIEIGRAAVLDDAYFREIVGKIIKTREWTKKELGRLGFSFADSKANFVFACHERVPAKDLFLALKENNIYVRHWDKKRISNYLRITIGTDEQMEKLIAFLEKYLNEN
ncbi:histidinol-phosphate transaminase [Parablautia intestinalis]|uniref:Histidinol-phosphate aminotransferase n=1 Tax=Parablautia intestinalis TaxID=2320100 RepID=A0A3A9ALF8_9FIRM|nr:histidinol-phosphate transaminase [Parablautia intestinalis]RKI92420.1 histidinol-phosphate transaminase [Parablautia intestinalis]